MRVIGGRWRGRRIEAPEGRDVTRPTTDRVREAMASMVLAATGLDLSGARVLDAFAGSGALGIELLSRGAASACFVEADRRVAAVLRRNLAELGAGADVARVVAADAFRAAARGPLPGGPFDVVLLDPPYATDPDALGRLVADLARAGSLAPGALVAHERAERRCGLAGAGLAPVSSRRYGSTHVDLLRVEGAQA